MLEVLFYIVILSAGFPAGIILAWLCNEEIKNWIERFKLLSIICLIIAILIFFIDFEYKIPVIISLFFIIITNLTIIWNNIKFK